MAEPVPSAPPPDAWTAGAAPTATPADPAASGPSSVSGPTVRARAEWLRLWCAVVAVAIAAAFITVAALLPTSSDGTKFHPGDQVGVLGVGLLIAGAFWLPTRPRVIADRDQIWVRTIVGPYKAIPWTVVRSVEFRPRWQWARIVLPADETISLYAVQRLDGARSVTVMRALRELHAAAHDRADTASLDTASLDAAGVRADSVGADAVAAEAPGPDNAGGIEPGPTET